MIAPFIIRGRKASPGRTSVQNEQKRITKIVYFSQNILLIKKEKKLLTFVGR